MVQVFMNSIQQPEKEFLGIMLGVTLELKGALRNHILQQTTAGQTSYGLSGLFLKQKWFCNAVSAVSVFCHIIKYSVCLTRTMISTILKVSRGAVDGEMQAGRSFLKPGHRLKIDSLTSLTISYWSCVSSTEPPGLAAIKSPLLAIKCYERSKIWGDCALHAFPACPMGHSSSF